MQRICICIYIYHNIVVRLLGHAFRIYEAWLWDDGVDCLWHHIVVDGKHRELAPRRVDLGALMDKAGMPKRRLNRRVGCEERTGLAKPRK